MPIGRIGPEFLVNSTPTGRQSAPAVTPLADGRFVMAWASDDGSDGAGSCIRARLYNADGSDFGIDFLVNSTTAGGQYEPSVTALADGRFVMTWTSEDPGDGSQRCIRARVFDADGSALGDDFIVNSTATGYQFSPTVTALADGRLVMTWTSDDTGDGSKDCIRARIFNGDGSAAGKDFIVNSTGTGDQGYSSVTALADGRFVVTWESEDPGDGSGDCVRARIYNADGSAAGKDFIVNSTTEGDQAGTSITALADGRFVVTWDSDDPGDGSGYCVRGRVFNGDGSAAGQDFIVNTMTLGSQTYPSVTALADGRFVVTWESSGSDGSGFGICARLYNADGSPAGNDFVVNTTTMNNQIQSAVTALADGRFVVTWESDIGDGSQSCIHSQVFDPTVFVGTAGADTWRGGSFADHIYGSMGADTLSGLGGNDTINGDSGDDRIDGGTGNDRLQGGTGDDKIDGGAGNDTLIGGTGNDTLNGGAGDDVYYVDSLGDVVSEAAAAGTDTIHSTVSYSLAGRYVETLLLDGPAAINATGNSQANIITGNAGANIIQGLGGDDTLSGGGGADRLIGGAGHDDLTGGTGADRFVFQALGDSTVAIAGRDVIKDFSQAQLDKIDISGIDANTAVGGDQAFSFIGTGAFTHHAGELRYAVSGGSAIVYGDVNGDGTADFSVYVANITALAAGEFIL